MTTKAEWQERVGKAWAQTWQRTDRAFASLTERLLARIAERDGSQVLDIGCGAGELALALARTRPQAQVVGLDVSSELVEAARGRAGNQTAARFELGDAAAWHDPEFAPDLLVSRHGVMFFDNPPAAFAHLRQTASSDAQLVFSCFRAPAENPWSSEVAAIFGLSGHTPRAPGPFAFADPQYIEQVLEAAEWGRIDIEPVDFAFVVGGGDDPVDDAVSFFSRIGSGAAALAALEGDARAQKLAELAALVERHRSGDLVAFRGGAWIVTAHADRRYRKR